MIQKEVNELRRRFRSDRSNINRIYGCYVNGNKDIIAEVDTSLGMMGQEESEMYLALLKKTLSGGLGRNLLNVEFSTRQVADSDEHRLLMALRDCKLEYREVRHQLYEKIIASVDFEGSNYLILLAADAYDVPYQSKDGETQMEAAEQVFNYFVCCICPVKDASLALRYFHEESQFHSSSSGQTVMAPQLGFLFPTFDNRMSNLYNALLYVHNPGEIYPEFVKSVFHTEPLMSAVEQHGAFQSALRDALEEECSFEVVQTVHEQIRGRIADHKESKVPEPLELTAQEVGGILKNSGVTENRVQAFQEECRKQFGESGVLDPNNIINSKKFEILTENIKITVAPEFSYLVETRMVDGRRYLMIPADGGVEINGVGVQFGEETAEKA